MNINYAQSPAFMGTLQFARAKDIATKQIINNHPIDAKEVRSIQELAKNFSSEITLSNGKSYIVDVPYKELALKCEAMKKSNGIEIFG